MFIGHYGPAVWDAHRANGVRLWHGFLAVQAIDIVSMVLSLLGVEGGGHTEDMHPLAFHIPWSHSLLSAIIISLAVAFIYKSLRPDAGRKAVWVIGIYTRVDQTRQAKPDPDCSHPKWSCTRSRRPRWSRCPS